jgi:hypothetical protein
MRLREDIRHKTEFEDDERFSGCFRWIPSYITTCFMNTTPNTPAAQLLPSSKNVAGKIIPPQAASNGMILRPGCTLLSLNLTMLATLVTLEADVA